MYNVYPLIQDYYGFSVFRIVNICFQNKLKRKLFFSDIGVESKYYFWLCFTVLRKKHQTRELGLRDCFFGLKVVCMHIFVLVLFKFLLLLLNIGFFFQKISRILSDSVCSYNLTNQAQYLVLNNIYNVKTCHALIFCLSLMLFLDSQDNESQLCKLVISE